MSSLARQHNWLIFRIIQPNLEIRLKQYARGRLLDIGCGVKPYAKMAAPYVDEHVGLDHGETLHDVNNADLVGTAYDIPAEDMSFQTVLCTDVLEHLEEPESALKEAFRVLQPGGRMILTVPLFWHLHEAPRDFYRYTRFGLDHLFTKAGFKVIEIKALTGFSVTFCQELVYFLYRLRRGGPFNPLWWLVPILGHLIQWVALLANRIETNENYTMEYIAVAQRPEGNPDA